MSIPKGMRWRRSALASRRPCELKPGRRVRHEILCPGLDSVSSLAIASQFFDHGAMGTERIDRARAFFRGVDLAIDVEDVFPGLAVDGAGLNLGEVGAQR